MGKRHLHESGTLVESKGSKGVYRIRLITEGKGSSGVYSRELLESYGAAFNNRPMFMNHPKDPNKPWERDVTSIAAKLGEIEVGTTEDGRTALFSEAKVDARWRQFVEDYSDVIGVSIYIAGEGREEGGEYIVESFDAGDPYSSVDFVVAAGREGRVERMLESYRAIETSSESSGVGSAAPAGTEDNERERIHMEELKALLESLAGKVDALTAEVSTIKTLSEQAAEADADKVEAYTVAEEATRAIAEAELPEKAISRVFESIRGGKAVADAIKDEKEYVQDIAGFRAAEGHVIGGGERAVTQANVVPRNW